MSRHLKKMRIGAMQISRGGAFQSERTACAKALGWHCAWHFRRKIEELKGDQGVICGP